MKFEISPYQGKLPSCASVAQEFANTQGQGSVCLIFVGEGCIEVVNRSIVNDSPDAVIFEDGLTPEEVQELKKWKIEYV